MAIVPYAVGKHEYAGSTFLSDIYPYKLLWQIAAAKKQQYVAATCMHPLDRPISRVPPHSGASDAQADGRAVPMPLRSLVTPFRSILMPWPAGLDHCHCQVDAGPLTARPTFAAPQRPFQRCSSARPGLPQSWPQSLNRRQVSLIAPLVAHRQGLFVGNSQHVLIPSGSIPFCMGTQLVESPGISGRFCFYPAIQSPPATVALDATCRGTKSAVSPHRPTYGACAAESQDRPCVPPATYPSRAAAKLALRVWSRIMAEGVPHRHKSRSINPSRLAITPTACAPINVLPPPVGTRRQT